jgi:dipeptidyl aminopeptidase/acylaminoacyl peptidase
MTSLRPIDLDSVRIVGSPTVSPSGDIIVCVQRSAGNARYAHQLWSFRTRTDPVPLFAEDGEWSDVGARFSPDGEYLAFISDRVGRRQAWLYNTRDRSVSPMGDVTGSIREVAWLGEGRLIALVDAPAKPYEPGAPAQIFWLRYKRDGRATFFERATELWLLGVDGSSRVLLAPDGRVGSMSVAEPWIAYTVTPLHSDDLDDATEIRVFNLAAQREDLLLTSKAAIDELVVTDHGREIVFVSAGSQDPTARQRNLWRLRGGGDPEQLFPDSDVTFEYAVQGDAHHAESPRRICVDRDGRTVIAAATVHEDVVLVQGDLASGVLRRLTPQGSSVTDFTASLNGTLAICLERPDHPAELMSSHLCPVDQPAGLIEQLSHFNTDWVANAQTTSPSRVQVSGIDGIELTGLLYTPDGPGPHPLVVRVHGGPHLTSGTAFNFEAQTEISAGYAVLLPNVRGSAGRGQTFRSLIVGEWGGLDYQDLMAFVNTVTDSPGIDSNRVFLAGGSYGGYLTNWALTKTDRFRAAISERSISNLVSKFGTSDNGFLFNRREFDGLDIFDDGIYKLIDRSPLRHVSSIRTPILLLHGEADQRCPIEQSEQLFAALRRQGREVTFVRFAGESHEFAGRGRPDHRIIRLDLIISWLKDHS